MYLLKNTERNYSSGQPTVEPGASGCEARMLSVVLCAPPSPASLFLSFFSYIFPTTMAKCLLAKALETPLIPIEDLFVTGIVGGKCGFSRKDVPGFYVNRIDPCGPDAEIVLLHGVEPEEQHLLQELMLIKRFYRKCRWTW